MIGYEARARVTADVAGFVAGQRQAAQAAGTLATAVQTLNTRLIETQRLAAQNAAALNRIGQTATTTGRQQQAAANSADMLGDAMRQGAAAYSAAQAGAQAASQAMQANAQAAQRNTQAANTNAQAQRTSSQSLQSMGRELARLRNEQERYQALVRTGAQLTRDQQESYNRINQRVGQLTQQYMRLSGEQRRQVTAARELAQASRLATQGIQEQSAAQVRLNQTGNLTMAQLQAMAREVSALERNRDRLMSAQREGAVLNRQEAQSLEAIQGRLRELSRLYGQLDVTQKQVFTSTRQIANANQAATTASRQVAEATREQERASRDLTQSHWGLRSAVGDVAGALSQLSSVSRRATSALWENFTTQEMTIAQISRVSQATITEMEGITASVRQMATEIPIAFDELGRITMLGSQVGVANESLGVFTETVALFAATSEISADETATLMARIMEMTNLADTHGQDAVRNLGSAVAYLGSNSLATDKEILTTTESIATMTTQVGFSAEATVGLASAMASLVIKPEIARGASQRVFLQLGEAVEGTGSEMQRLTELTNMSQNELIRLRDQNFEQFFFTVMEALQGAGQEGENLASVVRELGIINTRDAEVVARLAANYDLLEASVSRSGEAFESGQYLYEESDRIFATLDARVQLLANTWGNFLFSAGEAVAPFATAVIEMTTNIIELADSMNAAPILGWATVILGVAGAVAVLGSGLGFLIQGWLSLTGAVALWRGTATAATAATSANTAALSANAAAARASAISSAAAMTAMYRLGAGAGAATAAVTTTTGAVVGATAALRAFVVAHPVGAILALTAAVIAGVSAWRRWGESAESAEQRVLRANRAHIEAAGGMQGLQDALRQDTESWQRSMEAAQEHFVVLGDGRQVVTDAGREMMEYAAFRTFSVKEMADADKVAAAEAEALADAQSRLTDGIELSSDATSDAAENMGTYNMAVHPALDNVEALGGAQDDLAESSYNTEEALNGTIVAVGTATREFGAAALNSALMESAMWESAEAMEAVHDTGVNMGHALTREMDNAGDGVSYLNDAIDILTSDMNSLQKDWMNATIQWNSWTGGLIDFRDETALAVEGLREMRDVTGSLTTAIENAEFSNAQLIPLLSEMAEELGYTSEELEGMDDAAIGAAARTEVLGESVTGLGIDLAELADAFASFVDPLDIYNSKLEELNDGLDEGEVAQSRFITSLEDTSGFDVYLDGMAEMVNAQQTWSMNLLELTDRVPPQVLADLALMGDEGANLVQDLVNATDEQVDRWVELWSAGGGDLIEDYAVIWETFRVQAYEAGDASGMAFMDELLTKVATGQISLEDAVNEMIEYAEDNFESADPTMNFYAENTEAINTLNDTLTEVRDAIRDAERGGDLDMEPTMKTTPGFWDSMVTAWNTIVNWWGGGPSLNVSPSATTNWSGSGYNFADGGWIQGQGGPRQDNIPIMASNKEFMVNAASAARWGPLLEWINSDGRLPSSRDYVPQIQPDDNMRRSMPTGAARVRSQPDFAQMASAGVRSSGGGERIVLHINNHYPQAEPTSVTTNRALQYVAGLNGVL